MDIKVAQDSVGNVRYAAAAAESGTQAYLHPTAERLLVRNILLALLPGASRLLSKF